MAIITTILVAAPFVLVGFWATTFILYKASFRYKCQVAIPVGDSPNDVIWVEDKFKIKQNKGHQQVRFLRNRGKVYAPEYKFWSKWLRKNKSVESKTTDPWAVIDDSDIRKHVLRGAHFYKVSDLEYKVVKLTEKGDFKVLDHDSVELVIDDIERQNEITTSFKDKLIQMGMWLGSLLIISLLAIFVLVLSTKFAGEQSAQIINLAQSVATPPAQPVVGA